MPEKPSASSGSIGLKPRNVGIIIVLVILFIIFWSTFVIVPAGSRGVVLWWGSVENRIMGEGLNFKVPVAETVGIVQKCLHGVTTPRTGLGRSLAFPGRTACSFQVELGAQVQFQDLFPSPGNFPQKNKRSPYRQSGQKIKTW
jgi:hypothetical protein